MTTEVESADDQPTMECRICGRKFIKSSLEKHEPACQKLTRMQRKVFDSGKQRTVGSDIPLKDVRKAAKEREKMGGVFPRPHTHWRERHEEFIGAVSASKQVGQALKTGGPLPPPPKTAVHAGYVRCEFCNRTFNKHSADRHIEFCKEQSLRKGIHHQQNRTATGAPPQSRQKTGPSPVNISSRNGTGASGPIASKAPGTACSSATKRTSSTSSARSSRPGSAGPRRPSIGAVGHHQQQPLMQIGGAAVDGLSVRGQQSKLPQPTKRSNSAPRGNPAAGQSRAGSSKSTFATPKSASSTSGASTAAKSRMVKSGSKQKLG